MSYPAMPECQQGWILVTLLLLLPLLILGSVLALTQATQTRMIAHQWSQVHHQQVLAERWLEKIERDPGEPGCKSVAGLPSYGYCVKFLGADPCIRLEGTHASAGYFRITLQQQARDGQRRTLLETVQRKAMPVMASCQKTVQVRAPGRVSWREVEQDNE